MIYEKRENTGIQVFYADRYINHRVFKGMFIATKHNMDMGGRTIYYTIIGTE